MTSFNIIAAWLLFSGFLVGAFCLFMWITTRRAVHDDQEAWGDTTGWREP